LLRRGVFFGALTRLVEVVMVLVLVVHRALGVRVCACVVTVYKESRARVYCCTLIAGSEVTWGHGKARH